MKRPLLTALLAALVLAIAGIVVVAAGGSGEPTTEQVDATPEPSRAAAVPEDAAHAVFAGGCFWCMEEAFEIVPGVYEAVSGFAGGTVSNPSYQAVVSGTTGHYEVVRVFYDPEAITYEELLYVFWRNVDPLDDGGQFCDRGTAYRAAVFYSTEIERELAEASLLELKASGRFASPIVTEIRSLRASTDESHDGFWPAEEYHQNYYLENPVRYRFYKESCGRTRRLRQLWGEEAGAPDYRRA